MPFGRTEVRRVPGWPAHGFVVADRRRGVLVRGLPPRGPPELALRPTLRDRTGSRVTMTAVRTRPRQRRLDPPASPPVIASAVRRRRRPSEPASRPRRRLPRRTRSCSTRSCRPPLTSSITWTAWTDAASRPAASGAGDEVAGLALLVEANLDGHAGRRCRPRPCRPTWPCLPGLSPTAVEASRVQLLAHLRWFSRSCTRPRPSILNDELVSRRSRHSLSSNTALERARFAAQPSAWRRASSSPCPWPRPGASAICFASLAVRFGHRRLVRAASSCGEDGRRARRPTRCGTSSRKLALGLELRVRVVETGKLERAGRRGERRRLLTGCCHGVDQS
jgi:hypothetical protein